MSTPLINTGQPTLYMYMIILLIVLSTRPSDLTLPSITSANSITCYVAEYIIRHRRWLRHACYVAEPQECEHLEAPGAAWAQVPTLMATPAGVAWSTPPSTHGRTCWYCMVLLVLHGQHPPALTASPAGVAWSTPPSTQGRTCWCCMVNNPQHTRPHLLVLRGQHPPAHTAAPAGVAWSSGGSLGRTSWPRGCRLTVMSPPAYTPPGRPAVRAHQPQSALAQMPRRRSTHWRPPVSCTR